MDDDRTIEEFEKQTDNFKTPMTNWTRVIIETDEKNPKLLAVVTNSDCEIAEGLRVRLLPSYDACQWMQKHYREIDWTAKVVK